MKKPFVALLLLVGAVAMVATTAFADGSGLDRPEKIVNAQHNRELGAGAAQRLRVSAFPDPDTTWVGHSYTDHWNATTNYWNIYVGSDYPTGGAPIATNSIWDWDHSTGLVNHGIGDSLAGWWPTRRTYDGTGGLTLPDVSRPWWAIDVGNTANYVINQGPGGKRTTGVVGVWHADAGVNSGGGVLWSPLSGTKSAWCGLRAHGDLAVTDQITKNPFNQSIMDFTGIGVANIGSIKRYPGYGNQWDQMLYRDLVPAASTTLNISFLYRTRMSTSIVTNLVTRTGWFHGDPLAVVSGNFISSSDAGANAPRDSFLVYVGAPVNDLACKYSDGTTAPVYDVQRRWFSEVIRIFEGPSVPYYRIFAAAGENPADTASASPTASISIPGTLVNNIINATGNTSHIMRLVFRVKTNRGFADDDFRTNGYTSNTRGAAQIDDVIVNGSNIGDFELAEQGGVNSIDNRTGASAQNNWKSTGKPPSIYFHLRNITELTYNELCGAWNSSGRFCDIFGNVVSAGNYDDFERHCDSRYLSDREAFHGMWSPTINCVTNPDGVTPNNQGITGEDVDVSDDYYIKYDLYAGIFNTVNTGTLWQWAFQCYPGIQAGNGGTAWCDPQWPTFLVFNPDPQCFSDWEGAFGSGLYVVDSPSGLPDSMRFAMSTLGQCFRYGVTLGCNSADGAYFDNILFGFWDLAASTQVSSTNAVALGGCAVDPWFVLNDAFPVNETNGYPNTPANFDTTTALLKAGLNVAQSTGDGTRFDVLADTMYVKTSAPSGGTGPNGNQYRVDMVFRILPGPGNYTTATARSFPPTSTMQLMRVPTNSANLVSAGDGSFWGTYMGNAGADRGKFGKGDHHAGAYWDYLTWNSARCDTVENNIFPVGAKAVGVIGNGLNSGRYGNYMSERDPKFPTLGIDKFRCFVVDTNQTAVNTNIICDGTVPAWLTTVPQTRTGYPGTPVTKEYTKIIPDGLLTAGSHVEYFFRKSLVDDSSLTVLGPDTNLVYQSATEGSTDGHRWFQLSILPDRWKDNAFGGAGMACMLFIDQNDRRGNERVFASIMDSLGGTAPNKYGAYNGWHAPAVYGGSSADLALPANRVLNNQQPGTTWDMYGVKASESLASGGAGIGNRLSNRGGMGLAAGKYAQIGPTPEMLRKFYRVISVMSGDLNSGVLGPFGNRSGNDIGLLSDFLTGNDVGSTAQPRGLLTSGDGAVQSEYNLGLSQDPAHTAFMTSKLGVTLRNPSYYILSGNTNECTDLVTTSSITTNGDVYGVGNSCAWGLDVLLRVGGVPEAVDAAFYEAVGVNAPYVAAVLKPANGTRNWVALTESWDIEHIWSRYCDTQQGRLAYYYNAYNNVFGTLCHVVTQTPSATLDVPQNGHGAQFTNFMKVGNSLMRAGNARIHFGLANADRIRIRMYDVTGRLVRTLADRSFNAGEYDLAWDGADDSGNQVARGVYFARIEYAAKGSSINGRVVVLR